jgi:tetratricopeptide (TPR) repeat protein
MLNLSALNLKAHFSRSLTYVACGALPLSLVISAGAIGLLLQVDHPATPFDQALNLNSVDQAHPIAQLSENLSSESLEAAAMPVVVKKTAVIQEANQHLHRGEQAQADGHAEVALAEYAKAIDIAKAEGHQSFESVIWHRVGQTYAAAKDYKQAETYYQQSIELAKSTNNPYILASAQADLGHVYERQGKLQKALAQYRQALPKLQAIGDLQLTATVTKQRQTVEVALNKPAKKSTEKKSVVAKQKSPQRTIATTGISKPETELVKETQNSVNALREI